MQGNTTALETKLQEKEQLIRALTERLEKAAEQLDRIHRTGGDRGLRHAGLPPELIEQHQTLVEDMQRAVQQWEDMQATELLGRIETQLSELRTLVSGQALRPQPADHGRADSISGFMSRTKAGGAQPSRAPIDEPSPPSSGADNYERLKASLLQADGSGHERESEKTDAPDSAIYQDFEAVDQPDTVDFDSAAPEELKQAVEQRDLYISYLIRRLRVAESARHPAGNWSDLQDVPDELRSRLEGYEKRLDEALRQAELELSLERARLSREATRLKMLEQQVSTERKRFELVGIGDTQPRAAADKDAGSSRWLRMLGIGRTGEGGEEHG